MEKQYLDEEEARRENRAKRIAEMKRRKQKQAHFRKMFKIYAAVGAAAVVLAAGLIWGAVAFLGNKDGSDGEKALTARQETAAEDENPQDFEAASVMGAGERADNSQQASGDGALASGQETAAGDGAVGVGESNGTDDSENGVEAGSAEDAGQSAAVDSLNGGGQNGALFSAETTVNTAYVWEESVISSYVVLIDVDKKEIIAEKEANTIISPASMTKILTLLVAAEHVTDLEDTFTITREITDYSYSNDCSAVGFDDGETVTVKDLLYGTILPSGADAAAGLAYYVSGSLEGFVELMNDKLEELGISDTAHFTNCVGLYDEQHYCTVYDMAVILEAAISNDLCKEVLSAHTYATTPTEQHPEGITISNWFLRRIEDKQTPGEVMCAKTGFVNQSGNCAASYEETENGRYICVTANAHSSWRAIYDHVEIYNNYTK